MVSRGFQVERVTDGLNLLERVENVSLVGFDDRDQPRRCPQQLKAGQAGASRGGYSGPTNPWADSRLREVSGRQYWFSPTSRVDRS